MTRVAFVTGGTRGIGKAISARLKAAGYKVAAGYAGNEVAAQSCSNELGVFVVKGNVSYFADCAAAAADGETLQHFRREYKRGDDERREKLTNRSRRDEGDGHRQLHRHAAFAQVLLDAVRIAQQAEHAVPRGDDLRKRLLRDQLALAVEYPADFDVDAKIVVGINPRQAQGIAQFRVGNDAGAATGKLRAGALENFRLPAGAA